MTDQAIQSALDRYMNTLNADQHGRDHSWEHCYKQFYDAHNGSSFDIDYLSLHLAFYLASWGMYRGSSFLLQKDYKVHRDAVEIILNKDYKPLLGIECQKLSENLELLKALYDSLEYHYDSVKRKTDRLNSNTPPSSTLITKVLLGTLGCVPAYDEYFSKAVRSEKVAPGGYGKNSIEKLIKFYEAHFEVLEDRRKQLIYAPGYPQMKLLDMLFWQIGKDLPC